mgnify:CR=1 FL=1
MSNAFRFGPDGFDSTGFDKDGFDRDGFDSTGHDRNGDPREEEEEEEEETVTPSLPPDAENGVGSRVITLNTLGGQTRTVNAAGAVRADALLRDAGFDPTKFDIDVDGTVVQPDTLINPGSFVLLLGRHKAGCIA